MNYPKNKFESTAKKETIGKSNDKNPKIKNKVSRILKLVLSNNLRNKIKSFYYNFIIWPKYESRWKSRYGTKDFFSSVAIETTTYCNLRCKFCPNSIYERGLKENEKIMPLTLFKKIIDELAELNYQEYIRLYRYNEPLTDERLPYLIMYIKKKLPHAKMEINTNGLLFTLDIYKKLVKAGIDEIRIRLYASQMSQGLKEIFKFLKQNPKFPNKIDYLLVDESHITSNRGGEIKINTLPQKPFCFYPTQDFVNIDSEGNAVLCCNDYHGAVRFGNIKKQKLIEIWNKPEYKRLRKELRKEIYNLPICKKCVLN